MAPLPKKKHTRSRSGKRRGAKRFSLPNIASCPKCKKLKLPHMVCPHCGFDYHTSK